MYQQCPKCNGLGLEWFDLSESDCSVCKGQCIIHIDTGKPPKKRNGVKIEHLHYIDKILKESKNGSK